MQSDKHCSSVGLEQVKALGGNESLFVIAADLPAYSDENTMMLAPWRPNKSSKIILNVDHACHLCIRSLNQQLVKAARKGISQWPKHLTSAAFIITKSARLQTPRSKSTI